MTEHKTPRRIVDEEAAADYLHTSVRHLRNLRTHRQIPFLRVGPKLVRFDLDELDTWLDEHRTPARRAS